MTSIIIAALLASSGTGDKPAPDDKSAIIEAWDKNNPGYMCVLFLEDGCIVVRTVAKKDGVTVYSKDILLDRPVRKMYEENFEMYNAN